MFDPLSDAPNFEFVTLAAAQVTVPFGFMLFAAGDLTVFRDGVTCTRTAVPTSATEYSLTTTYGEEGGSVTFGAAAVGGEKAWLQRAVPAVRETNLPESGPFAVASLNEQLTKLVAMVQDILQTANDLTQRTLRVPFGETVDELAAQADRISKVFGTDGTGEVVLLDQSTFEGPAGPAMSVSAFYTMLAAMLAQGTNLTITPDAVGHTFTFAVTSAAAYTTENMQDDLDACITDGSGITSVYNDAGGTLTLQLNDAYIVERIQDVVGAFASGTSPIALSYNDAAGTLSFTLDQTALKPVDQIIVPLSDYGSAPSLGVKFAMRVVRGWTLTAVRGSLATAQTSGSLVQFDVKLSGVSIFSTKPTIDNGQKTTTTAATASVLSTTALGDDLELTFEVTQVGDGTARGLNAALLFSRT